MLAFVDLEERVPRNHPLRAIKRSADAALAELSPVFDAMYAECGRPSIPPERLLKASLLIALYSVRSERALCEELDYHLLYRWFLDMTLMEPSFTPTSFSKNRQRLLDHDVASCFFDEVVALADDHDLLSDDHFTVDGTLIEATASLKSFRRRGAPVPAEPPDDRGNPTVNFRGEKRSNVSHASTTDPEVRLGKAEPPAAVISSPGLSHRLLLSQGITRCPFGCGARSLNSSTAPIPTASSTCTCRPNRGLKSSNH